MGRYTITKEFGFDASHKITGLSADHPCAITHGHHYKVTLALSSTRLNKVGMIVDYLELESFQTMLDQGYNDGYLNSIVPFNPTAENLARHFFTMATGMFGEKVEWVEVRESDTTSSRWGLG